MNNENVACQRPTAPQRTSVEAEMGPTGAHARNPWPAVTAVVAWYRGLFWGLNGLDKFLNKREIGGIVWHGKDRTGQFFDYFTRLDIPQEAIQPVLVGAGVWELAVALPFAAAGVLMLCNRVTRQTDRLLYAGYVLTGMTLIGFSLFDIVAGDRAELREHGLYLALMLICCCWSAQRQPAMNV